MSLSSQKLRPVVSLDLTIDTKENNECVHCHLCSSKSSPTQPQQPQQAITQTCEVSTQTSDLSVNLVGGGVSNSSTSSISSVLKNKRYDYLMHHQLTRDSGIDSDHQQQHRNSKQEPVGLIKMNNTTHHHHRKHQIVVGAQQPQQQHQEIEDFVQRGSNNEDEDDDDDDQDDQDGKQQAKSYLTSSTRDNSLENENSLDEMTNDVVMHLFNKNVAEDDIDTLNCQDSYKASSSSKPFTSTNESALKRRLSFKSKF